jgi:CrcB protein
MISWLAVFLGGGLGSVARYGVGLGVSRWAESWPIGTIIANAAATLLLAATAKWMPENFATTQAGLLLMTGFCGGFSTFSTFSLDTVRLYAEHGWGAAALNVGLNVVGCVGLAWILVARAAG